MALIANSSLYIGTSLHGVITAMTYGLPHIGLNKKQVKVLQYLKTWGTDGLSSIQDPQSFIDYAQEVIEIPSYLILSKSTEENRLVTNLLLVSFLQILIHYRQPD